MRDHHGKRYMKKFWWGIFFGALIGVLLLAPESNFSNRVRELFDQIPSRFYSYAGLALPGFGAWYWGLQYMNADTDQWRELSLKAFVPFLTASLTIFVSIILKHTGWQL